MTVKAGGGFQPASRLRGLRAYRPPGAGSESFRLHANEGRAPERSLTAVFEAVDLSRYPAAGDVEARLASFHGVDPARVVLTAGADDALARLAFAGLEPGRSAVISEPTFEMIPRYVQLAGARAIRVPWLDCPFPEDAFGAALASAEMAFVVTPSSPAGEVVETEVLNRIAAQAAEQNCCLVVDLAYAEFADEDPTPALVDRGDVVVTRTFSKAIGVAGIRAGYAVAPREVADALRVVGQPFAVSSLTLAVVSSLLDERASLANRASETVRTERGRLFTELKRLGLRPIPSQGNFVLARVGAGAPAFADALAAHGLRVRVFAQPSCLEGAIRITCPQDQAVFSRLMSALPEAAAAGAKV